MEGGTLEKRLDSPQLIPPFFALLGDEITPRMNI